MSKSKRKEPPRAAEPESPARPWIPYAVVAVLAVVPYLSTLGFDFSGYDDTRLILENQRFLSDPSNLPRAFTQDVFTVDESEGAQTYYRPVLILSFMFDMLRAGPSSSAYHFTNIVIHLLASLALLRFLLQLGSDRSVATVCAVAFAAHPALSPAIAWVPGRNDSLLALFVILAFLGLRRFTEKGTATAFAAHVLACGLALFTKESGVAMFPLLLAFAAVLYPPPAASRKRALVMLGVGWVVVIALWYGMRSAVVESDMTSPGYVVSSIFRNSGIAFVYLGKALFPVGLSVYPVREDTTMVPGIVALIVLVGLFVASRGDRARLSLFGVAWFAFFLLPTFVPPEEWKQPELLEHRLYTPLIGLLVFLVQLEPLRGLAARPRVAMGVTAGVGLLFGALSFVRASDYRDEMTLWESAVQTSPSSERAHSRYGMRLLQRERLEEAEGHFRRALEIDPEAPYAHNNLGMIHGRQGKTDLAEREFQAEIEVNPDLALPWLNLGRHLYVYDRVGEGVKCLEEAIRLDPDMVGAYPYLARAACAKGDAESARRYLAALEARGALQRDLVEELRPCVFGGEGEREPK